MEEAKKNATAVDSPSSSPSPSPSPTPLDNNNKTANIDFDTLFSLKKNNNDDSKKRKVSDADSRLLSFFEGTPSPVINKAYPKTVSNLDWVSNNPFHTDDSSDPMVCFLLFLPLPLPLPLNPSSILPIHFIINIFLLVLFVMLNITSYFKK